MIVNNIDIGIFLLGRVISHANDISLEDIFFGFMFTFIHILLYGTPTETDVFNIQLSKSSAWGGIYWDNPPKDHLEW